VVITSRQWSSSRARPFIVGVPPSRRRPRSGVIVARRNFISSSLAAKNGLEVTCGILCPAGRQTLTRSCSKCTKSISFLRKIRVLTYSIFGLNVGKSCALTRSIGETSHDDDGMRTHSARATDDDTVTAAAAAAAVCLRLLHHASAMPSHAAPRQLLLDAFSCSRAHFVPCQQVVGLLQLLRRDRATLRGGDRSIPLDHDSATVYLETSSLPHHRQFVDV